MWKGGKIFFPVMANETRYVLKRLDDIVASSKMKFKPKKSQSISLRTGKVNETLTFSVANHDIPTVTD